MWWLTNFILAIDAGDCSQRGQRTPYLISDSLPHAVGLLELITYNLENYFRRALELATRREKLDTIRSRLITNRDSTTLFDSVRFTRDLEEAYLTIMSQSKIDFCHASIT
jgi:predicted O-linked N-acetylglucosamine transferase (SPINDLY family)